MAVAQHIVEVHLSPEDRRAALSADARAGLSSTPKQLPPKWFYDARGSELFDEITRLPEYYLTRSEREILEARAAEIADVARAETLVEIGSGTSEKTRILLDALEPTTFVPFDVSEQTLRESAAQVAAERPGLAVHAVVGDFERHLALLPRDGRRLVAFLGSSIGNLGPLQRERFLRALRATLEPGDGLLLGTDLVKDPARLVRAYDDAAGVTAAFNLNVLAVLNAELAADFDLARFEHVARWNPDGEWIEMLLRSTAEQVVAVRALEGAYAFAAGELMLTEISAKFRRRGVEAELGAAGFRVLRWWEDSTGSFALSLSAAS